MLRRIGRIEGSGSIADGLARVRAMLGQAGVPRTAYDFADGSGMECLTTNVDALLGRIRRKYKEYGINEKPFVIVKADDGSHGLGVTTVRDAKDFETFGRQLRERNLPAGEGPGLGSHDVIIQEGVLTQERVHDSVAEPVIY